MALRRACGDAIRQVQRDGQGGLHGGITADGEGGVVALGEDGGGAGFTAELGQDLGRVAGAHEQAAAAAAQVGVQRAQAVEEEGRALVAGVGRGQQATVEDEDGQDLVGGGQGGAEGLVIGKA